MKLARLLVKFKLVRWMLSKILPHIRFSTGYAKFGSKDFYKLLTAVCPGDFLLSVDRSKLSTYLIPGYWSHAAVVVGVPGSGTEIAEMVAGGFKRVGLFDFCKESDDVVLIRVWKTRDHQNQIIKKCLSLSGAKYDLEFEHGDLEYYCSELCAASDDRDTLNIKNKPVINPDDIFNSAFGKKLIILK